MKVDYYTSSHPATPAAGGADAVVMRPRNMAGHSWKLDNVRMHVVSQQHSIGRELGMTALSILMPVHNEWEGEGLRW